VPSLNAVIDSDGALVDVLVGWSSARTAVLRQSLRPVPPTLSARALVDCGAEITCIDSAVIRTLSLPTGSFTLANLPALGGLALATQHDASLIVLHPSGDARLNLIVGDLLVVDLPLGALGYQVLLGRDVLALCEFLYQGPSQRFQLSY
jgi:hypothetical protein